MASGPAAITFNTFGSGGEIQVGGMIYQVRRHGVLFGSWTLERDNQTIGTAEKPTVTATSFKIHWDDGYLTGIPPGRFSDGYDLQVGGVKVGQIVPTHIFTRRATMQCEDTVPEFIQLFAFWMAADTKRSAAMTRHA